MISVECTLWFTFGSVAKITIGSNSGGPSSFGIVLSCLALVPATCYFCVRGNQTCGTVEANKSLRRSGKAK